MEITAETPLLASIPASEVLRSSDDSGDLPVLPSRPCFPPHTFTNARKTSTGQSLPQAIAHRGYKAKYPENTMPAFQGAVEIGADALETDVHLTKDNVVVLSHDPTLKRCFGQEDKIIDHDWEYIKKLKTVQEPPSPMPRLNDLLEYLAQPGLENIWLLLDIKLDNNMNDIMRLIAETIQSVPPSAKRPWSERIVLGIWAAKYLPLCHDYLPGFPITHIGFSTAYASRFFAVPNVSFNMLQQVLMTPWGRHFIRKAHSLHRPIYAWTVNEPKRMNWAIKHGLDGVITDDPKLFLDVRDSWHDGVWTMFGVRTLWDIVRINVMVWMFGGWFARKFKLGNVDKRFVEIEKSRQGA